jgi:hypothetical protein
VGPERLSRLPSRFLFGAEIAPEPEQVRECKARSPVEQALGQAVQDRVGHLVAIALEEPPSAVDPRRTALPAHIALSSWSARPIGAIRSLDVRAVAGSISG